MKITCKLCNSVITSLVIDQHIAAQDLSQTFMEHLKSEHREQANKLGKDYIVLTSISVWYLSMTQYIDFSDSEFLKGEYAKWQEKLREMLNLPNNIPTSVAN